jgi:hypothetical protein
LAFARLRALALTTADTQNIAWYLVMTGLARGRARQVVQAQTGPFGDYWSGSEGKWAVMLIWWLGHPGFDSVAAEAAVRLRAAGTAAPYGPVLRCAFQLYRAATGDTAGARRAVRALAPLYRKRRELGVCPAMVEALIESHGGARAEGPALDSLETLVRLGSQGEYPLDVTIPVLVDLRRRRGEYQHALSLARIEMSDNYRNHFRPTLLRQRGELLTMIGDTAAAIRAYREYLALRTDPDPGPMREEVDRVRAALAGFTRDPQRR